MAKRRFQDPKPFRRGNYWYIQVRRDYIENGATVRKNAWQKIAPASMSEREVKKEASEQLRSLNQGLESYGGATGFRSYVEDSYMPTILPLLAKSTSGRSRGVIKNYLLPVFGKMTLRDMTPMTIQTYFSGMASSKLAYESIDKIRDVLAGILASAKEYGLIVKNPVEKIRIPPRKRGRGIKPTVTPAKFDELINSIPEPYATMVYVAVYTGLRVSELIGLRWSNVHADSITISERCCRGDWGAPKSEASNATIAVNRCVIERIHRLKLLTVSVKAGRATRTYKVVKADGPNDIVFQSVRSGSSMRDNNILTRFIKPAGRALDMPWLNWRCLRTSHATWLKLAGADIKDAQSQMRHSRASTTLDIYQQFVPESQQKVVNSLSSLTGLIQ